MQYIYSFIHYVMIYAIQYIRKNIQLKYAEYMQNICIDPLLWIFRKNTMQKYAKKYA